VLTRDNFPKCTKREFSGNEQLQSHCFSRQSYLKNPRVKLVELMLYLVEIEQLIVGMQLKASEKCLLFMSWSKTFWTRECPVVEEKDKPEHFGNLVE
jgi:hypothetical protein